MIADTIARTMPRPLIQIFTAIEMERRAVCRALTAADWAGPACSFDWRVTPVGIRAVKRPPTLLPATRFVVMAGLAGGLDPALGIGVLVLDVSSGSHGALGPNIALQTTAVVGRIVSSDEPVTTPAAKASLFQSSGAVAVDMEGDIMATLVQSAGVPFVHLRAISDAADQAIDPRALSLVSDLGRPRPLRVARYLLRDPRRISTLKRLGADAQFAAKSLGLELARLMPQLSAEVGRG